MATSAEAGTWCCIHTIQFLKLLSPEIFNQIKILYHSFCWVKHDTVKYLYLLQIQSTELGNEIQNSSV